LVKVISELIQAPLFNCVTVVGLGIEPPLEEVFMVTKLEGESVGALPPFWLAIA
jgi:hypothetical protein